MRSYIERVIAEIPLFFSHFSQCLFRPKHFIQQQLSSGKIIFSALLSLVFVYAASLLLSLMQTGSQMMALYRACPPS